MISIFPPLYPDETMNSIFYRYHIISGNTSFEKTQMKLFGRKYYTNLSGLPINLDNLCNQLNGLYTPEYFIYNHTIFPLYAAFMNKEKINHYEKQMKANQPCRIMIGINDRALVLDKGNRIKVCRKCMEEDKKKYGQAYPHVIHQIEGNYICNIHNEILQYCLKPDYSGIYGFIDINDDDVTYEIIDIDGIEVEARDMSKNICFAVENYMRFPNIYDIHRKYKLALYKKGYMSMRGYINNSKLARDFFDKYPKKFLNLLYSADDSINSIDWTNLITNRKLFNHNAHPIGQLLYINFLFGEVSNFLAYEEELHPFGEPPWPCYNPAADHYMEKVVCDFKFGKYNRPDKPIGVFTCDCGYVYSSKDIDENKTPIKMVTMRYGPIWEGKLKEHFKNKKYTVYKLSKIMGCETRTIRRLACKYGDEHYCDNIARKEKYDYSYDKDMGLEIERAEKIKKYISENKDAIRNDIYKACNKEYKWLYKHHRELLESILPPPIAPKNHKKDNKSNVNWEKRDENMYVEVEKAISDIKGERKPRRVTITAVGRQIGYIRLPNYLDKLPKTKALLKERVETSKQFAKRKIDTAVEKMIETNDRITKWSIIRQTGLERILDKDLENYIEKAIEEQMNKNTAKNTD